MFSSYLLSHPKLQNPNGDWYYVNFATGPMLFDNSSAVRDMGPGEVHGARFPAYHNLRSERPQRIDFVKLVSILNKRNYTSLGGMLNS